MPDRYDTRECARIMVCMAALALTSCERREGFPISEEPTAVALQPVAAAALAGVRAARGARESAERDRHLEGAEFNLRKLTEYYLPLLDAKDRAYEAYRLYYLEPQSVERELGEIEKILRSIEKVRGPEVEASIVPALELVTEARAAIDAGLPSAPAHLRGLARRLSYMLLKGELVL